MLERISVPLLTAYGVTAPMTWPTSFPPVEEVAPLAAATPAADASSYIPVELATSKSVLSGGLVAVGRHCAGLEEVIEQPVRLTSGFGGRGGVSIPIYAAPSIGSAGG